MLRTSLEFFAATDNEVAGLNDFEILVDLLFRDEICATGAENFQEFELLLTFFEQDEKHYPREIIKTVRENKNKEELKFDVYKLENELVENIAGIDKARLNNEASVAFWQSRGYFNQ